jgi:hypothetical protein
MFGNDFADNNDVLATLAWQTKMDASSSPYRLACMSKAAG